MIIINSVELLHYIKINMKDSESRKKNYSSIIILLLIIALGYTGYLISNLNKENHEINKELSNLLLENDEMNQILINEDALSSSKTENLKNNLKLMLSSYDSLEESNNKIITKLPVGSSVIANNYFWLHGRKPFKENKDLSRELLRIRGSFFIN